MEKYHSTKKIGPISVAHRQWKGTSHCRFIHGYGRYFQFTFTGEQDEQHWIVDYGSFKGIKKWLEEQFDHKLILASDDPHLEEFKKLETLGLAQLNIMDVSKGYSPSIEGSCKYVFDYVKEWALKEYGTRVTLRRVEIWEHEFNSSYIENTDA